MLTANGKAVCKFNGYSDRTANNQSMTLLNTNNSSSVVGAGSAFSNFMSSLIMVVGTSATEPTSHDYTITNQNAGLTVLNRTNTHSVGSYTQDYIAIYTVTYRNNTENDITVSEAGIIGNDAGGAGSPWFLLARDVFDSVTIAPGETYTFSMYIG